MTWEIELGCVATSRYSTHSISRQSSRWHFARHQCRILVELHSRCSEQELPAASKDETTRPDGQSVNRRAPARHRKANCRAPKRDHHKSVADARFQLHAIRKKPVDGPI